jgi:hypothetical protein
MLNGQFETRILPLRQSTHITYCKYLVFYTCDACALSAAPTPAAAWGNYEPAGAEDQMADDYAYPITQCDVPTERRAALQSYRDKRHLWLSWLDKDEHHAIWQVLSSMVWTDVSFNALTHFAMNDEGNALSNTLLAQALIDGHVATQVLAIRRLMDGGRSDIISLRRLGSRLIKSTIRDWQRGRQRTSSFVPACRIALQFA